MTEDINLCDIIYGSDEPPEGPSIETILGNNLHDIRRLKSLTQEDIGRLLGVSAQQIQKYEKGVNSISASKLYELSRVLKLPIRVFYEGLSFGELAESAESYGEAEDRTDRDFHAFMRLYLRLNINERQRLIKMLRAWVDDTEE